MNKVIFAIATAAILAALSACGGGGGRILPPPAATGSISGSFNVNGTLPEGATFQAQLYRNGTAAPVATATLTLSGTRYDFEFTEISLGTYRVRLVGVVGTSQIALAETGDIVLTESSPDKSSITANALGTDGTLSGSVKVAGDFPADKAVYIYAFRTDITLPPGPPDNVNSFTFDITAEMIVDGWFEYDIENMSYGVYRVQLLGYDFATHEVTPYGEFADDIVIDVNMVNNSNIRFAAGFGVEPPTLDNGVIRGTVSFTGTPDWTMPVYVSANTIPPRQGAPLGNFEITEANYNAAGVDFEFTGLPQGQYSVSIFQYNFTTHKATYFGNYEGNGGIVDIATSDTVVENVDFTADWSLLE
ncbi:MAG: hypothetical protein HRF49_00535 [bacterium]